MPANDSNLQVMQGDPRARVDADHSYFPDDRAPRQQRPAAQATPSVTVTSSSPVEEHALRRPLNLGIATAAANTAARTAAQRPMHHPQGQPEQPQSRVQQKLQRNNSPAGLSMMSAASNTTAMHISPGASRNAPPSQKEHVLQPHQQQPRGTPRQAGPNGIRPLELRNNATPHPHYPQQQVPQARRPALPVLQVTVPQPTQYQPTHARPQGPQQQQQQQYRPQRQGGKPASPFSSSSETLVGASPNEKSKYANNGIQKDWSPSSSTSSSSHTHNTQHAPPSPAFAGHQQPHSPYGQTPSSPSIKNFQLSVPSNDDSLAAHPDNDRLSPAMPRHGANQRDWWKRFSHVIKENEVKEQLAEKTGGKGSKVQSEWLDAQAHKQRKYRIWVAVVAFVILAAIGGGVAYYYVTKDKDSENAVTQPTTHGFEGTSAQSPTSIAAVSDASTPDVLAAPSAVPAGNIIGTRDTHFRKRGKDDPDAVVLLAARSMHAHTRRLRKLHELD